MSLQGSRPFDGWFYISLAHVIYTFCPKALGLPSEALRGSAITPRPFRH